jgi:general secretion pathway protein N
MRNARTLVFGLCASAALCAPAWTQSANPSGPEPAAAQSSNPLAAISIDRLSAARDRPLFSRSRRPFTPPPVNVAPRIVAAEPPAPRLSLLGTVTGEDASIAIFLDQAANRPVRLRIGEVHDGWTVTGVSEREARVERDGRSLNFKMPNSPASPASLPSVGAPAGPPAERRPLGPSPASPVRIWPVTADPTNLGKAGM